MFSVSGGRRSVLGKQKSVNGRHHGRKRRKDLADHEKYALSNKSGQTKSVCEATKYFRTILERGRRCVLHLAFYL